MNTELLTQVRDRILAEPLRFDMTDYVRLDTECGTACCIAGTAVFLVYPDRDLFSPGIHDEAEDLLGLTWQQAMDLFLPTHRALDEVTPAEAAATIDRLIETGEVSWT